MYLVQPEDKVEVPAQKKTLEDKMNKVLQGTPSRPYGLYDFLLSCLYIIFTGTAILFKRRLPESWTGLKADLKVEGLAEKTLGKVKKEPPKVTRVRAANINSRFS